MRYPPSGSFGVVLPCLLVAWTAGAEEPRRVEVRSSFQERIVNGVLTTGFPSVALLLIRDADSIGSCTGTLIGCRTILTAAHCFCPNTPGNQCSPNLSTISAVFLQHAGVFATASVNVHPEWNPAPHFEHDLAVVRLSAPINGVSPSKINTISRPPSGTLGVVSGFGLTAGGAGDLGLKRAGLITTADCNSVPGGNPNLHVCWQFLDPLGAAGEDSSTCFGDSGGPLFLETSSGLVFVGGVTSAGLGTSCLPPTAVLDADVFIDRSWILSEGGADLNNSSCGSLPQAGTPNAPLLEASGTLDASNPDDVWTFDVPSGTQLLRLALNAENPKPPDSPFTNDFDLLVRRGSEPSSASSANCASVTPFGIEFCDILNPSPGTWYAKIVGVSGPGGGYQLAVTTFLGGSTGPACQPNANTLCIGDRFRVRVSFSTSQGGGASGQAEATSLSSLGITTGGIFSFFGKATPELLVKVLRGCGLNSHYWVFYAATTNVGFTLTVEDLKAGVTKTYGNTDGTTAVPITDTSAFATCP